MTAGAVLLQGRREARGPTGVEVRSAGRDVAVPAGDVPGACDVSPLRFAAAASPRSIRGVPTVRGVAADPFRAGGSTTGSRRPGSTGRRWRRGRGGASPARYARPNIFQNFARTFRNAPDTPCRLVTRPERRRSEVALLARDEQRRAADDVVRIDVRAPVEAPPRRLDAAEEGVLVQAARDHRLRRPTRRGRRRAACPRPSNADRRKGGPRRASASRDGFRARRAPGATRWAPTPRLAARDGQRGRVGK